MDQFSDIQIIEANRLHSEEAKGGNNENFSLWTNNLQDILMLNPKDQVSVYGAFISERGAGQSSSIEIKGQELGQKRKFKTIKLKNLMSDGDRKDNNLPSRYSKIEVELDEPEVAIKDNELNFLINYFVPANALNSMYLPRRWQYPYSNSRQNYTERDNRGTMGASLTEFNAYNNSTGPGLYQAPAFYSALTNSGDPDLLKPKHDNSRYTLMIRDKTLFTENSLGTDLPQPDLPTTDMRDPENAIYRTYSELKTITLPAGFNSPDFIATEVSRQLQNIINEEVLVQDNSGVDQYPQSVSKLLESETYKAFYVGNIGDNTKNLFEQWFNLVGTTNSAHDKGYRTGWNNASGYEWQRQYHIIACKYPELYETGRLINRTLGALGPGTSVYNGIKGSELMKGVNLTTLTDPDEPLLLAMNYTKDNCDLLKAFFDAQKIYPEIIENLNDRNSGYNAGCDIDNTRWIHINRYSFRRQSLQNPAGFTETQLGWGGYYQPRSWIPPTNAQLQSLLLPLFHDKDQSEIFYEKPEMGLDQFTYGCIGRVFDGTDPTDENDYYIAIYPFKHATNGIGSPPFNELKETDNGEVLGTLEGGRKIGFDMHFNAPGMYYILPQSGWSSHPDFKSSQSANISIFNVPNPIFNSTITTPDYLLGPWKKLLYIGADNPRLNWDGTNFSFADFHTSMNRGNTMDAGKPYFATPPEVDDDAQDIVYKINPPDLYNDYTPDRCPYTFDDYNLTTISTLGPQNFKAIRTNPNYLPFQIYDQLCGIMVEDFGVPEELWTQSLWGLLGFSYKQFHGTNNRQVRIQRGNANNLSLLTTNAEVIEGDTKIFSTNWASVPLYNNMINTPVSVKGFNASGSVFQSYNKVLQTIVHKTTSMTIIADNLPTRMIRGYYTIRSNILEGSPFIGGKVNNTTMPIIGIVDKINGDGDFYFGQESSLTFTITKPIRLASLTCSIHDPDGSYARTSEQSTILLKIQRPVVASFNIAQEMLQEQMNQKGNKKTPKM